MGLLWFHGDRLLVSPILMCFTTLDNDGDHMGSRYLEVDDVIVRLGCFFCDNRRICVTTGVSSETLPLAFLRRCAAAVITSCTYQNKGQLMRHAGNRNTGDDL